MSGSLFLFSLPVSVFLVLCALPLSSASNWVEDDEKRLVNFLFKNYNKGIRPVEDKKLPVPVSMSIALTQLIDLDEKNQILITSVWLRLRWSNSFLKWNPSHYGGINTTNVEPSLVWLPDIELYNSADGNLANSFKKKVILRSNGISTWYIPVILRSFCQVDIEYFPFDEQTCTLKFGSWSYHGLEVEFRLLDTENTKSADLEKYQSSGEFELVSFYGVRKVQNFSCCDEPYINLIFTIHFRRKMLFYLNNLVVPCILVTLASLFTFILPPNTGERVTLVITTLLSLTVFMLMIAENTPTNSDVTPMIAKFFMASMMEIGLALVVTCLILNVYHSTRHSLALPHFIRVFAIDVLAPLLFVATPKSRKSPRGEKPRHLPKETKHEGFLLTQTLHEVNSHVRPMNGHVRRDVMDSPDDVIYHHQGPDETVNSDCDSQHSRHVTIRCSCRGGLWANTQERLLSYLKYLAEREIEKERNEEVLDEWEIVAKVADRAFLVLFIITIVCTSLLIFTSAPRHSEETM